MCDDVLNWWLVVGGMYINLVEKCGVLFAVLFITPIDIRTDIITVPSSEIMGLKHKTQCFRIMTKFELKMLHS